MSFASERETSLAPVVSRSLPSSVDELEHTLTFTIAAGSSALGAVLRVRLAAGLGSGNP